MVSYVVYGRGSFNQLDEILAPHRKGDAPMIFLVDHYFTHGESTGPARRTGFASPTTVSSWRAPAL